MKQQLSPTAPAKVANEENRLIKMCKELYKNDKSNYISITELLRVSTIGVDHWKCFCFEKEKLIRTFSLPANQRWHSIARHHLVADQDERGALHLCKAHLRPNQTLQSATHPPLRADRGTVSVQRPGEVFSER